MADSVSLAEEERIAFFSGQAGRINDARLGFLRKFLPSLISNHQLYDAIDIGCGPGFFSHELASMGLETTGIDVREGNIVAATNRHPDCHFISADIERSIPAIGRANVVLALGLFYHLENPLAALRNTAALSNRFLIIESMVIPDSGPMLRMFREPDDIDQGTNSFTLIPSRDVFLNVLSSAGFLGIYESPEDIAYYDFRYSSTRSQRRRFFLASRDYLSSSVVIGSVTFSESRAQIPNPPRACEWNTRAYRWVVATAGAIRSVPELILSWAFFQLSYTPRENRLFKRLRLLLVQAPIFKHLQRSLIAYAGGFRYTLAAQDDLERRLYVSGAYERDVTESMRRLLPHGNGTLVDIGAHHGMHSLYAKCTLGTPLVICFEPSARERQRLIENIRLNASAGIIVSEAAISDRTGVATLRIADNAHSGHNSLGPFRYRETSQSHTEQVPIITLGDIFTRYPIPTDGPIVLKIDVEGHELQVLRSGIEALKTHHPALIIEVSRESVAEVQAMLESIGYSLSRHSPISDIADTANLLFT